MRILLTGASGFIGRALYAELNHEVNQIIRITRKKSFENSEVIVGDFENFKEWDGLLKNIDVIIHLAGRAHIFDDKSKDQLEKFRKINVDATINLAKSASRMGVKRLIFMSSIGVNGKETHSTPFSIEDAPMPCSPYALSKYEAELALQNIANISNLELVIIRPPLVYGPNAPGNFQKLVHWLSKGVPLPLGSITDNLRSFVGVDNLIDLIIKCIDNPLAANKTFLISDGEDFSTTNLLYKISHAFGKNPNLFSMSPRIIYILANLLGKQDVAQRLLGSLQIDIQYTCNTLNWKPPLSVEEGFKKIAVHQSKNQI